MGKTKRYVLSGLLIGTLSLLASTQTGCQQQTATLHPLTPMRLLNDRPWSRVEVFNPKTGQWEVYPHFVTLKRGQGVFWPSVEPSVLDKKGE